VAALRVHSAYYGLHHSHESTERVAKKLVALFSGDRQGSTPEQECRVVVKYEYADTPLA